MADLSRGQGYHYTEQAHAEGVEHANAKVRRAHISTFITCMTVSCHVEQAHAEVVALAEASCQSMNTTSSFALVQVKQNTSQMGSCLCQSQEMLYFGRHTCWVWCPTSYQRLWCWASQTFIHVCEMHVWLPQVLQHNFHDGRNSDVKVESRRSQSVHFMAQSLAKCCPEQLNTQLLPPILGSPD